MSARRHALAVLCAAMVVVSHPIATSAQDVSSPNLKAAYIYKMAPFTEWPPAALPPGAPLTACVVGDSAVHDALERFVRGLNVSDRPVVVTFDRRDVPPPPCHIMYISGVSNAEVSRLVAAVAALPVLTIGDSDRFNELGGIVEFFYEAGNLDFSISRDAANRAGLTLSSRLLLLGPLRP